jgi:site-specific DNA-methyltransferase (adenine-specific)
MCDFGFEALEDEEEAEVVEDDFEVELPEEPRAKLGDIYQLGNHRLMCGDSTSITDIEKLMDGNKANMVFTDPPYLMGFTGNVHADGSKSFNSKHGAIKNDKMSREDGDQFILDIFTNIKLFNKGAYYVCFYRLGLDYIFRALDKLENQYKALIIWNKGNHTLSNSDYMSKYEPIVYGWFDEHLFYGDRSNFDIWDIQRTQKNDLHPTMKPIPLCSKAIENSSKKGDIVLDLFGGSGSTLIACEQLGRTCYMNELDPKYVDVIINRWEQFTGKKATLLNDSGSN